MSVDVQFRGDESALCKTPYRRHVAHACCSTLLLAHGCLKWSVIPLIRDVASSAKKTGGGGVGRALIVSTR